MTCAIVAPFGVPVCASTAPRSALRLPPPRPDHGRDDSDIPAVYWQLASLLPQEPGNVAYEPVPGGGRIWPWAEGTFTVTWFAWCGDVDADDIADILGHLWGRPVAYAAGSWRNNHHANQAAFRYIPPEGVCDARHPEADGTRDVAVDEVLDIVDRVAKLRHGGREGEPKGGGEILVRLWAAFPEIKFHAAGEACSDLDTPPASE